MWRSKPVRDVMALCRLLLHPEDDASFGRALKALAPAHAASLLQALQAMRPEAARGAGRRALVDDGGGGFFKNLMSIQDISEQNQNVEVQKSQFLADF